MTKLLISKQDRKGQPFQHAHLENDLLSLEIVSFGAATKSLRFLGKEMVLGYEDPAAYFHNPFYLGVIAGRVANRTAFGRFELDGKCYQLDCNDGPHHLHGGNQGLSHQNWEIDQDGEALVLGHVSPDGQGGYPAEVFITLRISLQDARVIYELKGRSFQRTPLNLAQHNYYALANDCRDLSLWLDSPAHCPVDEGLIPTGEILPADQGFDFRQSTPIGQVAPEGLDHNFVLGQSAGPKAILNNGTDQMRLFTDQTGLQVYTGHGLPQDFGSYSGLCLEPQAFPNCVNQDGFETCIIGPDRPYYQRTEIEFERIGEPR